MKTGLTHQQLHHQDSPKRKWAVLLFNCMWLWQHPHLLSPPIKTITRFTPLNRQVERALIHANPKSCPLCRSEKDYRSVHIECKMILYQLDDNEITSYSIYFFAELS